MRSDMKELESQQKRAKKQRLDFERTLRVQEDEAKTKGTETQKLVKQKNLLETELKHVKGKLDDMTKEKNSKTKEYEQLQKKHEGP
eukprot:UN02852